MKKFKIIIENIIPGTSLFIAWVPDEYYTKDDMVILFNREMGDEGKFAFEPGNVSLWPNQNEGYYLIRTRKYGLLPFQLYIENLLNEDHIINLSNKEDIFLKNDFIKSPFDIFGNLLDYLFNRKIT